mmetsp:Transcript_7914/g.12684  ORF Transcript_7914/g.12684 Transcript_7914/m.12684 type:complete len:98 (+) Transcript_7914:740-1033(+)
MTPYITTSFPLLPPPPLSNSQQNKRFSVNARRALAGGYQKIGEYDEALKSLLTAFHLAAGYPEAVHSRVALTGEIADLYTDMGELKKVLWCYSVLEY